MLSTVATCAPKLVTVSNWKLDSSRTANSISVLDSNVSAGTPILPPTPTLTPASAAICPTKVVTVLLALEPVIATIGTRHASQNS